MWENRRASQRASADCPDPESPPTSGNTRRVSPTPGGFASSARSQPPSTSSQGGRAPRTRSRPDAAVPAGLLPGGTAAAPPFAPDPYGLPGGVSPASRCPTAAPHSGPRRSRHSLPTAPQRRVSWPLSPHRHRHRPSPTRPVVRGSRTPCTLLPSRRAAQRRLRANPTPTGPARSSPRTCPGEREAGSRSQRKARRKGKRNGNGDRTARLGSARLRRHLPAPRGAFPLRAGGTPHAPRA